MNPQEVIRQLDQALLDTGETVTIRRYTAPTGSPRPKVEVVGVMASVRGVKADEMVGKIVQTWSKAVLSPTGLTSLLPIVPTDKFVQNGREREIEFVDTIRVADTVVRMNLLVAG